MNDKHTLINGLGLEAEEKTISLFRPHRSTASRICGVNDEATKLVVQSQHPLSLSAETRLNAALLEVYYVPE